MKKLGDYTKGERILVIISIVWFLIIFVFAINETRGDFDEEFMGIFLLIGVLPVLAVVGWRWIQGAPTRKD